MNENLALDIKFKTKDVLRYNISVARKSIVNCIVMLIGIGTLIYVFCKLLITNERLDIFLAHHIVFIVVAILIFVMIPGRVWKITLSQMQLPAYAYGVTYIFSKEAIILKIGEGSKAESETIDWTVFVKIIETRDDFRFYVNQVSAQIIPKHNLSKVQLNDLRQLIKEVAGDRAILLDEKAG